MSDAEIIDVVDEKGNVLDTIPRGQAEANNHITKNVLVFLFNKKGQVWLQLRPKTKKHYPGMWDVSACGGIISGETADDAAHRETLEETGIDIKLKFVEEFLNVMQRDGAEVKVISNLYVGITDEKPEANDEVDDFKAWNPEDLISHAADNKARYIPTILFELKKALKAYNKLLN